MIEPSYLQLLLRLPTGTHIDAVRALLARGPSDDTWEKVVRAVSKWPDEPAAHEAVQALVGFLDVGFRAATRLAPYEWWNAAQSGVLPVGWPLVRRLRTKILRPGQRFDPCTNVESLRALVIVESDDRIVPLALLREGATAMRELGYIFETAPRDRPAPLDGLAALTNVERLDLLLLGGGTDLTPLAAMTALRELVIDIGGETPLTTVALAPLAAGSLASLQITVRAPLNGAPVALAQLPALRSLYLDPAPAELAALPEGLERLELFNMPKWHGTPLPSALRELRLESVPGFSGLADLANLKQLETLKLFGMPDLTSIDVASLPTLRDLEVCGCPRLGTGIQLGDMRDRELRVFVSG